MPSIHLVIYFLIYCQLPEGIVSVKREDCVDACKSVMIDGTTYSMVELPGSETQVVVDERHRILDRFDLGSLQQKLGRVGRCIQLANYGTVAAGSSKLQIEVGRLGNNLARLGEKSANAVSTFKRESTAILTDLQATYEYLVAGSEREELALETLSSVSNIAGKFALVAEELHNSFNEKVQEVQQIVENMQEAEVDEVDIAEETKINTNSLKKKKEVKTGQYKEAQDKREEAKKNYFESELEESIAISNLSYEERGLVQTMFFSSDSEQSRKMKATKVKALNQKKNDTRKILTEREEKEEQVYESMADLMVDIQYLESIVESANSSASTLHKALEALKPLVTTMIKVADFWERIQEHCNALNHSKLRDKVASEMREHSDEQRLTLWISTPFKTQVVSFNAGWVALNGILDEYMGSITETQEELYEFIEESPTREEAKKNICSLAAKFQKDLQNAKKACAKKGSECRR